MSRFLASMVGAILCLLAMFGFSVVYAEQPVRQETREEQYTRRIKELEAEIIVARAKTKKLENCEDESGQFAKLVRCLGSVHIGDSYVLSSDDYEQRYFSFLGNHLGRQGLFVVTPKGIYFSAFPKLRKDSIFFLVRVPGINGQIPVKLEVKQNRLYSSDFGPRSDLVKQGWTQVVDLTVVDSLTPTTQESAYEAVRSMIRSVKDYNDKIAKQFKEGRTVVAPYPDTLLRLLSSSCCTTEPNLREVVQLEIEKFRKELPQSGGAQPAEATTVK